MIQFGNDWDPILAGEFEKEYYRKLRQFLIAEYRAHTVYPHMNNIYAALKYTSYADCKIVLLGQDPYHGPGQAHGLAFSVNPGVEIPPSLLNMYKELKAEFGCKIPNNGYLVPWSRQGVLLLNTSLTVRRGEPNSHADIGWAVFTDRIIDLLNGREDPVIFLLWGSNARKKAAFIDKTRHYILEAPHPSPLSAHRGFFGCGHFRKTNEILRGLGKKEIDWAIPDL
ncbi:MAG: uracil-DNA glycosylase [Fusobacteriaceae bacterium]|jgi:uracil-DNA glycosylase|nr:uracil-DNA glycosylase [Fusobacteriaceae bacterium]